MRCGRGHERGPATTLRLYAGCGIVAGSTAEAEIAESEAKLDAVRQALRSARTDPYTP